MIRDLASAILARTTALAGRFVAATKIELHREPLFDEVIDRGVKGVQTAQLLALELLERRVNSRIT